MNAFQENKFYMMMGSGKKWSDFDGPFDTAKEAVEHLSNFITEYASPEMMSFVIVVFRNGVLDLAKDDNNSPINGQQLYWKNEIWYDNEMIYDPHEGE